MFTWKVFMLKMTWLNLTYEMNFRSRKEIFFFNWKNNLKPLFLKFSASLRIKYYCRKKIISKFNYLKKKKKKVDHNSCKVTLPQVYLSYKNKFWLPFILLVIHFILHLITQKKKFFIFNSFKNYFPLHYNTGNYTEK